MKPSEERLFETNYEGLEQAVLPSSNAYDFLYERTKDYMNNDALSFDSKKIKYYELHERIDEYTRAFLKRGIKKGTKVAVCLVNNPESVYTIYALKKIGACVIGISPLNNEYKTKRDLEMTKPEFFIGADMLYKNAKSSIKDLEITPILYSPIESIQDKKMKLGYNAIQLVKGNKKFGQNSLKHIIKDGYQEEIDYSNPFDPKEVTDIMFTGGSSGFHKGVCLNDNGLNCVVYSLDWVLKLEPGQIHLGNIPFGHMAFGRLCMHYVLCNGMEYALTLDALPNKFYDEIVRTKANGAMGGPVHWRSLIEQPVKKGSLSFLTQAISGGEMLKSSDKEAVDEALRFCGSNALLGDGLGLTETWAPTHINYGGINTVGTIGWPIPFVNAKVIDPKTNEELDRNERGLLYVSSPGLMLGYLDNPKENEKVLVTDDKGITWYNTGDMVKRLDTDEFKFSGRMKRNFVCGVDNIYPEEIEDMILKLEEVRDIVVTKIPDEKLQFVPIYHISLSNPNCDTKKLEDKINTLILSTLGESAMASVFKFTNEPLPRTDNGKLNATLLEEQDKKEYEESSKKSMTRILKDNK